MEYIRGLRSGIEADGRAWQITTVVGSVLLGAMLICSSGMAAQSARFEVGLVGDLPYTPEDEQKFPNLMRALNAAHLAFVVHMGDIEPDARAYAYFKTGTEPCTDQTLQARKALFDTSSHPFILTPGDNDWTDCRYAVPAFDPLERLARLRDIFFAGDRSLGNHTLVLRRQSADPGFAGYRENTLWRQGGVLFLTLDMVGSNNNLGYDAANDAEFAERTRANLAWIERAFDQARREGDRGLMILTQANPGFETRGSAPSAPAAATPSAAPGPTPFGEVLDALERETLAFGKPVVFVHGDTHYFRVDKPLLGTKSGRTIENFTRVEVFGSPNVHWVRAIVDPDDPGVFTFRPELVPANGVDHLHVK